MNYMVMRTGEETKRVFLDEISVLIIENPAISITGCLMNELVNKKIKVVFCDNLHDPSFELTPLYGSFDCSKNIYLQTKWSEDIKGQVWTSIVSRKIVNQSLILKRQGYDKEYNQLQSYVNEIEFYDKTNREGHAAKVYFNRLFDNEFSRNDDCAINAALDYGYKLILSMVNREIVANGYITQLGLFHRNQFNDFNLSCDLMEPFRQLIDRIVLNNNFEKFETDEKRIMQRVFEEDLLINGQKQSLHNTMKIYVKSVLDALTKNDVNLIKYYEL